VPCFIVVWTTLMISGDEVASAFRAANPTLPEDSVKVVCNRGQLSEVRICLTRTLAIRSCGRDVRSSCPLVPVQMRAAR